MHVEAPSVTPGRTGLGQTAFHSAKPGGRRRATRHQTQEAKELWALAQINPAANDKVPVSVCSVRLKHIYICEKIIRALLGEGISLLLNCLCWRGFHLEGTDLQSAQLGELSFLTAACYKILLTLVGLQVLYFIHAWFIYRVSILHYTLCTLSSFLKNYSL